MPETAKKVKVVQRYEYADYLNLPKDEAGKEMEWNLMGTGFTALDEEPGAQSESTKYVNEKAASSDVVGYETKFPFEADQIADEKCTNALYDVGRNHLIGADAQFEYVRVEMWRPIKEKESTFAARKFLVSAEVSEVAGENKQKISGNLNAVGDPILGEFNTSTKTFTPLESE